MPTPGPPMPAETAAPAGARVLLTDWTGKTRMVRASGWSVRELKEAVEAACGIAADDQLLSSPSMAMARALLYDEGALAPAGGELEVVVRPRCLGGKGGFGAMLRGQSSRPGMKQVTPNTGAMRDLSGRRLRHVEQEQKLSEWAAESEKRKAEKEAQKKEKRQKVWDETHKQAEDYVAEARVDMEDVSQSVVRGLEEDKKRREREAAEAAAKKKAEKEAAKKLDKLWGDDGSDDSSSGDEEPKPVASSSSAAAPVEKPAAAPAPATPAAGQPAAPAEPAHAAPAAGKEEAAAPPAAAQQPLEDIDVEKIESVKELEALGGDRLKFALGKRGMKSGGTPEQRAQRLWSVRGLPKDQWPKNVLAPTPKPK